MHAPGDQGTGGVWNHCLNGICTTRTKAGKIDMGHGRQVYCVPPVCTVMCWE